MFCQHVFGNISGGFRVFGGNSRDFAENPEIRGSVTAQIIRSPDLTEAMLFHAMIRKGNLNISTNLSFGWNFTSHQ